MLVFDFSDFPVLETERLLLRRLADRDVAEVFALRSSPEAMKYIPRPLAQTHDDARKHIGLINDAIDKNEAINWAVTLKGSDRFVGIIGFHQTQFENFRSEIGYMILPEHAGKGIASEAIARLVGFAFNDLGLHSIEAVIDPENVASERVLQKNGFAKEAHFRENFFYEGKFLDSVIYSLVSSK